MTIRLLSQGIGVAFVLFFVVLFMYKSLTLVYAADWNCNPLEFYYDVNKNKVLDAGDKRITEEVKKLIRDGKQYFPLNTFVVVSNQYCKQWLYLHWCSNTVWWTNYVNGIDQLTVYEGGKVVPTITQTLQYRTNLKDESSLSQLLNLYKSYLFTDISYTQNYNGELNPFDYVPFSVLIPVEGIIKPEDFENIIMKSNLNNIVNYINTHYPPDVIRCEFSMPTTAYAKFTCWREKVVQNHNSFIPSQSEVLSDTSEDTNFSEENTNVDLLDIEQNQVIKIDVTNMYLNFEMLFSKLNEKNLANLQVVESISFTTVGGTPVKVVEGVDMFYIDKPVRYSFIHTPKRIRTCHVDPHGVNVCL